MPYNNGRLYVDTSVTPNIGVSIPDLQQCFQTVVCPVSDQNTRRLSSDLGVIVATRLNGDVSEKYFEDNGVRWQVFSRRDINPWARYRPIACQYNNGANNTPLPLTDQQRLQEAYGIDPPVDMYAADDHQQAMDYANDVWNGTFSLRLRPFGGSHWKRMTDFAKTGNDGKAVGFTGYDHNAQPDDVVVTIGTKDYRIVPLIPEGQRDIYAPKGRTVRFQFPNDQEWVDEYYKLTLGRSSNATIKQHHPEWLAPMDLMGMNAYQPNDLVSVLRGVYIMKWAVGTNGNGSWTYVNRVRNTVLKTSYSTTYNTTTKNSFMDLTQMDDGAYNNIDYYMELQYGNGVEIDANAENKMAKYYGKTYDPPSAHHDEFLWNLEGEYLFIEFWNENNNFQNIMPIPGLCYTVRIYRDQVPSVSIDVPGIVEFLRVQTENGGGDDIYLYFRVLTTELSRFSGNVLNVLNNYYSVLTSTTNVNNTNKNATWNLLTDYNADSFIAAGTADGYTTFQVFVGKINDDFEPETEPVWTDTITARQKSATANQTKVFNIDRSSLNLT